MTNDTRPTMDEEYLASLDERDDEIADIEAADLEATRAQIEQTRAEMSETLEAIKEKLNPETLMEQAKETLREATIGRAQEAAIHAVDSVKETVADAAGTAREAIGSAGEATQGVGRMIVQTLKENPLPAALTGLGLAWLWMSARQQSAAAGAGERSYSYDYPPSAEFRGTRRNGDRFPNPAPSIVDQTRDRAAELTSRVQDQVSDLGSKVQERVSDLGSRVQDQASELGSRLQDQVSSLGSQAQYQAARATEGFSRMLQENPLVIGAAALAVGAGLALAVPTTPQENRIMGETRDQLVDRAQEAVQDVAHKAQSAVQEAMSSATNEARS
jgi:gas vesicle protein